MRILIFKYNSVFYTDFLAKNKEIFSFLAFDKVFFNLYSRKFFSKEKGHFLIKICLILLGMAMLFKM